MIPPLYLSTTRPQISTLDFSSAPMPLLVAVVSRREKKMDELIPLVYRRLMYLYDHFCCTWIGASGNTMPLLIKASQGREHDAAIGRKNRFFIVEDEPVFRSLHSWLSLGSDNGIGRRRGGMPPS